MLLGACAITHLHADDRPRAIVPDGNLKDWPKHALYTTDPSGDATGPFDLDSAGATSQGRIVYFTFKTTQELNVQNGPDADKSPDRSLRIVLSCGCDDDPRTLTIDSRNRIATFDGSDQRVPWESFDYVIAPTHSSTIFEARVDLGKLGMCADCEHAQIAFDGSDALDEPIRVPLGLHPPGTTKSLPAQRAPATDFRVACINTLRRGLVDPERADAFSRLLRAADADVYCFQEEWELEGVAEALERLSPTTSDQRWHVHHVTGCLLASKHPFTPVHIPSGNIAAGLFDFDAGRVVVGSLGISAFGYIGSEEDARRIEQIRPIADSVRDGSVLGLDGVPLVIAGDFNLVGSTTPLDVLTDQQGPALTYLPLRHLESPSIATWRGGPESSFSPGMLDLIVYDADSLRPDNAYILNTLDLSGRSLRALDLQPDDSRASDHDLLIADFSFADQHHPTPTRR